MIRIAIMATHSIETGVPRVGIGQDKVEIVCTSTSQPGIGYRM